MAGVPPQVVLDPDVVLLAAAKARKKLDYAKEAIARARIQKRTESAPQNEPCIAPDEGKDHSPALPPPVLTEVDGQPLPEDVEMLDVSTGEITSPTTEPPQEDYTVDMEDPEKFKSIEKWYNRLKNPSMADEVRYAAARRKLDIWNTRSESQRHLQQGEDEHKNGQESENELFVSQDDPPSGGRQREPPIKNTAQSRSSTPAQQSSKKKQQNRISADEKRRSMEVGFEPIREKLQGKKKRGKSADKSNGTDVAVESRPKQKGIQKKNTKCPETDMLSSLHPNLFQEAHESSVLPALAGFTSGARKSAIAELVASIPSVDQEVEDDAVLLKKALKKFNNRVQSNRNGCWRMRGLTTSMYHHQLLGCAWMRDRENSPEEPKGGLLCDEMGFGKTFEALVNIVDGFPADPHDPVKTTLIVAPSHLVKHWMDQMRAHCDEDYLEDAIEYHANAKLSTLNVVKSLLKFRIVVTTYDEIRRSYPVFKPPKDVADVKILFEEFKRSFEGKCGPLHRIKYHRIVLDEAQMIKNKDSSVSIAVRGLTARYKWVLSGTPVQNSNEEFYPLFDFLGVFESLGIPRDKSYERFMADYCSEGESIKRLNNMLRTYMFRRTHASRFMSLPIIDLPDISETRIDVDFSEAEWILYEAIEQIFLVEINDLADAPDFKLAQCKSSLTMILRLRMFCSHLLTVQHIIKFLMRSDSLMRDLKKLAQQGSRENPDTSSQIVHWLQAVKSNYKSIVTQREADDTGQAGENLIFNNDPSLVDKFREFMQQLRKDGDSLERFGRVICPKCKSLLDKGVVTSCMHLYCEECFATLQIEAENLGIQSPERAKPVCLNCMAPIDAATRHDYVDALEPEKALPPAPATRKERRKVLTMNRRESKQNGGFTRILITLSKTNFDADNREDEDGKDDEDWIRAVGYKMPSAKLTAIRDKIKQWKSENGETKVVIFSQFMDFIRILGEMCRAENWEYRSLTGKMRIPVRHKNLEDFKTDQTITILIVSLHTGGTGLDMTVAHKCILVDLWWNEAVQNQAFCRLLRHGQPKNVECVKMVVAGSIDDYMLELQCRKTEEISSAMGDKVLKKRDTVIDLLNMFSDVTQDETGRLHVKHVSRKDRKGRLKAIMSPQTAEK
ncbi:SNF2 family N-terminal domain-containing protein [Aspergillus cavernicola]|uniref:SNF2 family N-terminal domain-containing protein n=1 Tax=Aspergillus cavernicola TaxID=176166 RepID=A0ABR4HY96_9EURO